LEQVSENIWEIPKSYREDMRVPARIFANKELLSKMKTDRTLFQAANVATLPGIIHYAFAMPDAHEGYGFPIGGVAAVDSEEGVISPGGVGYDVNCLCAETRVLTPLGYRLPIEELAVGGGVVSFASLESKPTKVALTMSRREGRIVRIRTQAGLELSATFDHPMLTVGGMRKAGIIRPGDAVGTHPFIGLDFERPGTNFLLGEPEFRHNIRSELLKRGLLPLGENSAKLPYLIKLLAYFMGDGAFDGKKTWFYGTFEGMEELRRDISAVGYTPSRMVSRYRSSNIQGKEFDSIEYSVYVSAWSFRELLEKLGAPAGNKTAAKYGIPAWLGGLPAWMKRLFLAAYCGAEMNKPQTVNGYNFEPPVISMTKTTDTLSSGRQFLEGLSGLFRELGVKPCGIREEKAGEKIRLKLVLSEKADSVLNLWSKVGYIYTPAKQRLAMAAAGWLSWKKMVVTEREQVGLLVAELHRKGYAVTTLKEAARSRWANEGFIRDSIHGKRSSSPRVPATFPAFEDWLTYSLEGDVVWDVVTEVVAEDYDDLVYDITVDDDAHNFAADGFVVSNCGVRLIRTNLSVEEVRPVLPQLLDILFRLVPSGVGSEGQLRVSHSELASVTAGGAEWAIAKGYGWDSDVRHAEEGGKLGWAKPEKVSPTAMKRGAGQLGTLGSGNHFLEIETVDGIFDEEAAKAMGIVRKDQILVLVHTGSRGFGHQVCSDYLRVMEVLMPRAGIHLPDRELAAGPVKAKETEDYLGAMACAANFAWVNRQMITHWVREGFAKVFRTEADKLDMQLIYDVAHNIVKLEEHDVDGARRKVYVHRKGATRAFPPGSPHIPEEYRGIGQPVLIPGSMGTASWVLKGTKKAMEASFGTAAHGAGRFMSRSAAKREYGYEELLSSLQHRGILVRAASRETVTEEAPGAYKDVDSVVEVTHAVGLAEKVVRLTPIGVVKG
jgi:tRNA-splicing ligase RtcB